MREHLESVEKQTGLELEELNGPVFPDLLSHIWSAFSDLSNVRGEGVSGPSPIDYKQITDWSNLTGTPVLPWEVKAITKLDITYRKVLNERS